MRQIIWLFISLFMISGCQKKNKPIKLEVLKIDNAIAVRSLQESIARLSQIPDTPLQATVKDVQHSDSCPDDVQIMYTYEASARDDIKDFYMQEMERLGWHLEMQYDGLQDILFFSKPNGRVCTIVLNDKKYTITLTKKT